MLKKLSEIIIPNPLVNENNLKDFKLSNSLKLQLNKILSDKNIKIDTYSSYAIEKKSSNYAVIPNQYFLYASIIYPYAIELFKYFEIFDSIRTYASQLLGSSSDILNAIARDNQLSKVFESKNDMELFSKFLSKSDSSYRAGAKRLIDDNGKPRSSKDCFGSVILKIINLPDASSSILGSLVYYLTNSNNAYSNLYNYYKASKNKVLNSVVLKNSVLRDFAFETIKFFNEKYHNKFKNDLEINSNDSDILNLPNLKSVIRCSNIALDRKFLLKGDGKSLNYFENSISNNGEYWYVSTQWYGNKHHGLNFFKLKKYIEQNFEGFSIVKDGDDFFLLNSQIHSHIGNFNKISKPFLLLAGISGTGKTRFVREQVKFSGDLDETYCLVPVRPDWHEPSDLLGYVSRLSGDVEYVSTDVLKFIVKAWIEINKANIELDKNMAKGEKSQLQSVRPYWLCLDEMNLAPVEQYFADYLSILETCEWQWTDDEFEYSSEPLLKAHELKTLTTDSQTKLRYELELKEDSCDELWQHFLTHGIGVPFNLIVAGTVNMDETTHGFSRKVIDRALSFDFGEFYPNNFDEYFEAKNQPKALSYPLWTNANDSQDLLPSIDDDGKKSIEFLKTINNVLENTPFKLAFRALNELLLSVICHKPDSEVELQAVWDDFLMCKVLPRIEGDIDKLSQKENDDSILVLLSQELEKRMCKIWEGEERPDLYRDNIEDNNKQINIACRSRKKLEWMESHLEIGFTSFWP